MSLLLILRGTSAQSYTQPGNDVTGLVDSSNTAAVIALSFTDTAGKTDAANTATAYNPVAQTDPISPNPSDSILTQRIIITASTDPVNPSVSVDAASTAASFAPTFSTDTLGSVDTPSFLNVYVRALTDPTGFIDGITSAAVFSQIYNDPAALTDAATPSLIFTRIIDDLRNLTDAFGFLKGTLSVLPPDAILTQTGLTGVLSNIQEDPTASDGQWLLGASAAIVLRVSFPTPGGPLEQGAGVQKFRVLARVGN